jgi:hypothetical protein
MEQTVTKIKTNCSQVNTDDAANLLFSSCSLSFSLHIFCVKVTEELSNDGQRPTVRFKTNETHLFRTTYI